MRWLIHLHSTMVVPRRADAQENLKAIARAVAIVTIEFFRPKIDRELSPQTDVDLIAMGKIPHVTNRNSIDREDLVGGA